MPEFVPRGSQPVCVVAAFLVLVPALFADIVQPSPFLPPMSGFYSLPVTCVSVVCLENISLSNFRMTTSTIAGGDEKTASTADLTANLFQNVAGSPGKFISPLTLTGPVDITFFAKGTLSESGSFASQITLLDLSGSFVGLTGPHKIEAMLNPNQSSTGETTVTQIGTTPAEWQVKSSFDVFAELKIDDGTFVMEPERMAGLTELPEPAYFAVTGLFAAAMMAIRATGRKRRRRRDPLGARMA